MDQADENYRPAIISDSARPSKSVPRLALNPRTDLWSTDAAATAPPAGSGTNPKVNPRRPDQDARAVGLVRWAAASALIRAANFGFLIFARGQRLNGAASKGPPPLWCTSLRGASLFL